jgi:hypothetical protein
MVASLASDLDLTPPAFGEGLSDWSRGDGTPNAPTYETDECARVATGDADFGECLELRKVDPVQRLRYMGELPLRRGAVIEVRARIKALRGPLPGVRIAAWPGGFGGKGLPDLEQEGPETRLFAHEAVVEIRATLGRSVGGEADLSWDERALYAHVGLDLIGPTGGVVRIENLAVREIAQGRGAALPGFGPSAGDSARL